MTKCWALSTVRDVDFASNNHPWPVNLILYLETNLGAENMYFCNWMVFNKAHEVYLDLVREWNNSKLIRSIRLLEYPSFWSIWTCLKFSPPAVKYLGGRVLKKNDDFLLTTGGASKFFAQTRVSWRIIANCAFCISDDISSPKWEREDGGETEKSCKFHLCWVRWLK
jgi:hypothetical protein